MGAMLPLAFLLSFLQLRVQARPTCGKYSVWTLCQESLETQKCIMRAQNIAVLFSSRCCPRSCLAPVPLPSLLITLSFGFLCSLQHDILMSARMSK